MNVQLTVRSTSEVVLSLVGDFARGLGCGADRAPASAVPGVRISIPDGDQGLIELLTHVALGATKAGVDLREPSCELAYQHGGVSSEVRLVLRIDDLRIDAAATAGT